MTCFNAYAFSDVRDICLEASKQFFNIISGKVMMEKKCSNMHSNILWEKKTFIHYILSWAHGVNCAVAMYFQLHKQINMASLSEENLQLYNPIFSNQVWFLAVSLNYRKGFQRPLKKLKSKHAFQVTAKKRNTYWSHQINGVVPGNSSSRVEHWISLIVHRKEPSAVPLFLIQQTVQHLIICSRETKK